MKYDEFMGLIDRLNELEASTGVEKPTYVVLHPDVWNGFWHIQSRNGLVGRWCRTMGRKFHNPYLYMVGRKVEWMIGLKDMMVYGS